MLWIRGLEVVFEKQNTLNTQNIPNVHDIKYIKHLKTLQKSGKIDLVN